MSEGNTPPKDSTTVPPKAWPWIVGVVGAACTALFIDNRTLRKEKDDVWRELAKTQQQVISLKDKQVEDADKRARAWETIAKTGENISRFIYNDSSYISANSATNPRQNTAGHIDSNATN